MYSSSYSRAKFGLEGREVLHRSRGKSCGYYMKIIFFFSSLIQSLIIVSLVLFLVYGQPEKAAEEKRAKELELGFNRLSENNVKLTKEKADLTAELGVRTGEKGALEKEVETLKTAAEAAAKEHAALQEKMTQCETEKNALARPTPVQQCPTTFVQSPLSNNELKIMQSFNDQQKAMIRLIEANFTNTVRDLSLERDNALKDRDKHHQEAITLRKDNVMHKEQLTEYTRKCKEDFAKSLEGIQVVTAGFLTRIDTLFPHQLTFHLTCERQQEQLEKIKTGCTNLSKEVEDKFQKYLDNVGDKVAHIQSQSSQLTVQNIHLNTDLQLCQRNRNAKDAETSRLAQETQQNHDKQVEKLLREQNRLRQEKQLQGDKVALREAEIQTLKGRIQILNIAQANCQQTGPPRAAAVRVQAPPIGAPGISKPPTAR